MVFKLQIPRGANMLRPQSAYMELIFIIAIGKILTYNSYAGLMERCYNMSIREYIDLIKCFEVSSRFYWIDKLEVCNSIKGYLIVYFNL